jgi:hypothetical protein
VLIFADDNCRVTKLKEDAEAPLLSTVDGVEYPSSDVPVRLIHGRATFKLKISQVSTSKDSYLKTPPMLSGWFYWNVGRRQSRSVDQERATFKLKKAVGRHLLDIAVLCRG